MVSLADHFNFKNIFKMTISPILMMIFISLYGIVDGFFVSNYAGLDAYAGLNLVMPIVMVVGGIGFMFGTGGSALSSKLLGEGRRIEANQVFTMMLIMCATVGLSVSAIMFILMKPIVEGMASITKGSTEEMVREGIIYGRILCSGQVFFMIQNLFHSYFVVDEKPKLGFRYTLFAGITNMVLDFLFIYVFKWGVAGAAIATVLGYVVGGLFPFIYFIKNKDGNINLVKTKLMFRPILQCCSNGVSEFVNNISMSIVGIIFNIQLLRYYGEMGVSAYGTLMYVSFIFVAVYIGYSIGMAPVVGYNYGARNKKELRSVLLKSLTILGILALLMFGASELIGPLFSKLYVGSDSELFNLTKLAFSIFSIQFIFCGISIFLSSFFTALNNGLISALISFLRTLFFQVVSVFTLPLIFGEVGIWWSIIVAEFASCVLSLIFLFVKDKQYGYLNINKGTKKELE